MAWVRIHDGAMTHPKVIGLSDKAFRLWIWGLSYSQQHLTDGLLSVPAIPSRLARATQDLVRVGLWEPHTVGYKVHDYLDWNDGREMVIKQRAAAKQRMADARERSSQNVRTNTLERSSQELLRRVGVSSTDLEKEKGRAIVAPPLPVAPVDVSERAAALLERYPELFKKHRHGAHTMVKPALDFQRACDVCRTWTDDARLDKLIEIFLITDEPWIANSGRGFGVFASKVSWCDDKLRAWEAENGVAV